MKRTQSTGSDDSSRYAPKKPRGGEDSPDMTFEDELMMMEEADGFENFIEWDEQEDRAVSDDQSHRWNRPVAPVFNPDESSLGKCMQRIIWVIFSKSPSTVFQWLDIDMTSGQPWLSNPVGEIVGSKEGPVPVIRLYGVTSSGVSIMLSVHGFTPYFYVSLPSSIDLTETFMGALRTALDQRVGVVLEHAVCR